MIYLDNHATTPIDPEVLEVLLSCYQHRFANAASLTHAAGRQVAEAVEVALEELATGIGATRDELVITSGATESNNLALMGVCLHPRQKRRKVISVVSEHRALLDPLKRLEKHGFETRLCPVQKFDQRDPGEVDLHWLSEQIDEDTALVSVMLANNEIGTIQPLKPIAELCREVGAWLHTDASQAVGRIPVSVDDLDVDLLSFSGHKFYGPKGIGGLYVRRTSRKVRLQAQIVGGGQQHNMRSGTLDSPGLIAMSHALQLSLSRMPEESPRICALRQRLFEGLRERCHVQLNGPRLDSTKRLPGNLNCSFLPFEGQSLMLALPELCVSSGSACTSAEPSPSHVLEALGLSEDQARSSLRFGIGRMNTAEEIETAIVQIAAAIEHLRQFL